MKEKKQTLFQINDYSLGLRDVIQFIVALTFFLGLYYTMSNTLQTQGEQLKDLRGNVRELDTSVNNMNARLARMEGALGIKSANPQSYLYTPPTPIAQEKENNPLIVNIEPQKASVSSEPTPHPTPSQEPTVTPVPPAAPIIIDIPILTLPILGRYSENKGVKYI